MTVAAFTVLALLGAGPQPSPTAKKKSTSPKSATVKGSSTRTSSTKTSSKKTSSTKTNTSRKKTTVSRRTRSRPVPRRQLPARPTKERYREIEQALASRGYLSSPASGDWSTESVDALKRFQQDQNLTPTGRIDSLSLLALGLGPKRLYEP
ncbi:MAG: peptidoglycan-binding domain-containing protein [Bryobacteraceae bacterium]